MDIARGVIAESCHLSRVIDCRGLAVTPSKRAEVSYPILGPDESVVVARFCLAISCNLPHVVDGCRNTLVTAQRADIDRRALEPVERMELAAGFGIAVTHDLPASLIAIAKLEAPPRVPRSIIPSPDQTKA